MTMMQSATTSAEIKSAYASLLPYMDRKTPLPPAINKPVGPLVLSDHPGRGSFQIGTTTDGRTMIAGTVSIASATTSSARALEIV